MLTLLISFQSSDLGVYLPIGRVPDWGIILPIGEKCRTLALLLHTNCICLHPPMIKLIVSFSKMLKFLAKYLILNANNLNISFDVETIYLIYTKVLNKNGESIGYN